VAKSFRPLSDGVVTGEVTGFGPRLRHEQRVRQRWARLGPRAASVSHALSSPQQPLPALDLELSLARQLQLVRRPRLTQAIEVWLAGADLTGWRASEEAAFRQPRCRRQDLVLEEEVGKVSARSERVPCCRC